MIKSKKQMYIVIGAFALVLTLFTTTYAFFNYTRTGTANIIKTGRIYFNSEQGTEINLDNLFPIDPTETGIMNDATKVGTITINVKGDTTYGDGIEYLVSAVNVENSVGSKHLPISIDVSYSANGNGKVIGTNDEEYFDNRGGNTSIYKVLANNTISNNDQLVVGYISKGVEGIDGNIVIKAYIDKDKIAISDTYPEGDVSHTEGEEPNQTTVVDYTNGTTSTWANDREVFTTSEWNSLQTNGVSFQVKVEANEGTWVDEILTVNVMNTFPNVIFNRKSNIREVYFNRMKQDEMHRAYDNATLKADLTYNNEGEVLAWLEEDGTFDEYSNEPYYNLYIVSDGETYLTTGEALFSNFLVMEKIEFNNINTSRVTNMSFMFGYANKLNSIDLSNFDTSNVTNMSQMFWYNRLDSLDVHFLNMENVESLANFASHSSTLERINMSGMNLSKVKKMSQMFYQNTNMTEVNFSGTTTRDLTSISEMFYHCDSLEYLNLSGFGGDNLEINSTPFSGCNNLKELDMSYFNFGKSNISTQIFNGAPNLEILDLSYVNVSTFSDVTYLFSGFSKLKTIYVDSDWNLGDSVPGRYMFAGCTSLVGGAGTTYDSNNVGKEYAHIDGGVSNPGYFTNVLNKPSS